MNQHVDVAARTVVEGGSFKIDDDAPLTKVFDRQGDFAALKDAEDWLRPRGFSFGALQGAAPIAVMFGDIHVPKWRHLGDDVEWLHGRLDSKNWRAGPVTLTIRKDAPADVIHAFHWQPLG